MDIVNGVGHIEIPFAMTTLGVRGGFESAT
jgi:hypothetical protein